MRDHLEKFFKSLTGQFIIGIFVIHVVLVTLLANAMLRELENRLHDQFINEVRATTGLITDVILGGELLSKKKELTQILENVMLGGRVVFFQLLDAKGEKIFVSALTRKTDLTFMEDLEFGQHEDNVYFIKSTVVTESGDTRAILKLGFDESLTSDIISADYRQTIIFILIYFFITFLAAAVWAKRISRPVKHLRSVARDIASGHLERRMVVNSNISDINDLADDLEQMRSNLISRDQLTGLPNRRLFNFRLQQRSSTNNPFAVLLIDLDGFKQVNDRLGHEGGDFVLWTLGERLREETREGDTISRFGGDEFTAIIEAETVDKAIAVANKIVATIELPIVFSGDLISISASIGIAMYPEHGRDTTTLSRSADDAMYHAKLLKKQYAVYDPDMGHRSKKEL